MVCALLIMELVRGKEIEREFGQSEHSFAKEDVHWGPGNIASAYREQGKGKGEGGL